MHVIDWLLEDDMPGVELLARTWLLGESPTSRRVKGATRRLNDYPPVAAMLDRVEDAIAERPYQKYRGSYWTLIFLAEMQASHRSTNRGAALRRLANHVRDHQLDNGGFAPSGKPSFEIVCLTANILRALVHCGHGESVSVAAGYRRLAERILPNGGVPCLIIDNYTLLDDCKMTLPQTLRSVASVPGSVEPEAMRQLRALLVTKMLEIRVYRYVRPDSASFRRDLVPLRPAGTTQADFTREYRRKHRATATDLLPKQGWLRFGFPHSYNSDLLEAMLALAEAGAEYDPVMDEALDHIESRSDERGRWRMETSLNGRMLATVERKGRPSKWLTLQALRVLQHFGRVVI